MQKPMDDWVLPPPGNIIRLTRDELLLIDHVLGSQTRLMMWEDLHDMVDNHWGDIRLGLWVAMRGIADWAHDTAPLEVTRRDCATLLAACPTTFRWGPGPDCGESLKVKLAFVLAPLPLLATPELAKEEVNKVQEAPPDDY